MDREYIKELLNNYRAQRTTLWNMFIITFGGTISLFLKILNTKQPFFEILLLILGILTICFIFTLIGSLEGKIKQQVYMFKKMRE